MDWDDDVFYNFTDINPQLMESDGVTHWKGPWEKNPLFFKVLIDVLSKSEGIIADLIAFTCENPFVFNLI